MQRRGGRRREAAAGTGRSPHLGKGEDLWEHKRDLRPPGSPLPAGWRTRSPLWPARLWPWLTSALVTPSTFQFLSRAQILPARARLSEAERAAAGHRPEGGAPQPTLPSLAPPAPQCSPLRDGASFGVQKTGGRLLHRKRAIQVGGVMRQSPSRGPRTHPRAPLEHPTPTPQPPFPRGPRQ